MTTGCAVYLSRQSDDQEAQPNTRTGHASPSRLRERSSGCLELV